MLTAQKGLPMNRTSRASLPSQILVFLTVLCMPAVVRAVTVATPTFSPAAGTYTSAQTVTISDTTSGSTIYYTTNGSTPTTTSTKFTSAITVSASETLKAIATASGDTNSAVATAAYTLVAPTPALSLAAGSYGSSQTETITDSNSAATIYYTTNGTTPTTSSTKYAAAFTVNASETVEAIAAKTGYTSSAVASAKYTIAAQLPAPAFSVAAGTYTSSQTVSISDATAGTTIYYTTNGTAPTTSSSVYSGPITVSASETLEAIAVETGYTTSSAASAAYTISKTLPAPVFSVAAGTYTSTQTVSISDATAGTTIYYTTNGTAPTTSSTAYSGAVTVSATETLEAIAVETGYTTSPVASAAYTINPTAPAPTYSLASGSYASAKSVQIAVASSSALAYYTTDGSTPTTASKKYSGALWISANTTINAIAVQSGLANSPVVTATYTIAPVLATPSFSLAGGSAAYNGPQTVSISDSNAGVTIYYTTNGTAPTTSSNVYTGPITVSATETIEAMATETNYTNSVVATVLYTITPTAVAPTFSLASGSYSGSQTVTLADATAGTTIYYTTNGTVPTASSTKYTAAITVSASETVKAIAVASGYNNSPVATAAYTITSTGAALAAPAFSVASGAYLTAQTVSITDATAGVSIYYTTNGATPTTSSTKYTAPIAVSATETLMAFAAKTGSTSSSVTTAAYTIDATLPAPAFSIAAGGYPSAQTVTLSDSAVGATICFTLDGSIPTSASTQYTGPITVAKTEELRAIAIKTGYNRSPVANASYTIYTTLPTPTFTVAAGTYASTQTLYMRDAVPYVHFYYTTDGTTPTTSSTEYSEDIVVATSETLRVIAVRSGFNTSAAASATYIIK